METGAEGFFQPGLEAVVAVPDHAFEEGIHKRNRQAGCNQDRIELGPLGNTTGNNRRNRCGKGQQEEELHQLIAVVVHQLIRAGKEVGSVGYLITNKEVCQCRDTEVGNNLDQRIHLVFMTDSTDFQKRKATVHQQHHDGAQQDKQGVGPGHQGFNGAVHTSQIQSFHKNPLTTVHQCSTSVPRLSITSPKAGR